MKNWNVDARKIRVPFGTQQADPKDDAKASQLGIDYARCDACIVGVKSKSV
jgi:hypothetical protein